MKGPKKQPRNGLGLSGMKRTEASIMEPLRGFSISSALRDKAQWSNTKRSNSDIVSKQHFSEGISSLKKCITPKTSMKS